MKNLFMRLSVLCILFYSAAFCCRAQDVNAEIEPLKIGDSVPDIVFQNMINYTASTAKLSDFKGKAVILDFWATYCVPCIASFPKLERYQQDFQDELKILLLSYHDEKSIRELYKNRPDLSLSTAFYDRKKDVIAKLFPYKEIPHYVWVNADGKIAAITNALEINEENIGNLIKNRPLHVPMKNDIQWKDNSGVVLDSIEKDGRANKISINPKIIYQSMIMKYDPRLTQVGITGIDQLTDRYLSLQNSSVAHLMWTALGFHSSRDYWRLYIDLNDTTFVYPTPTSPKEYQRTWQEKHSYTYRVLLDRPDSTLLYKIMQRDLEFQFGIRASNKKVRLPYLVLRSIPDKRNLIAAASDSSYANSTIYKISISNRPVDDLVDALYKLQVGREHRLKQQKKLAVFDRTGIKDNISVEISGINTWNMQELNKRLREYGLELSLEYGDLDMTVITDK